VTIETLSQKPIRRRIPVIVVCAVEYPCHVLGASLKNALETKAILRGTDLPGVGAAHRCDCVGEHEPAFKEVYLPVELEPFLAEKALIEMEKTPVVRRAQALVTNVVHRQHGPDRSKSGIAFRLGLDKHK